MTRAGDEPRAVLTDLTDVLTGYMRRRLTGRALTLKHEAEARVKWTLSGENWP